MDNTNSTKATENIYLCPDGTYRWTYELSMLKNPIILFTVLKVFGVAFLTVFVLLFGIDLFEDGRIDLLSSGELKTIGYVLLFFAALVLISYLIVAAIYGWKYIVLFEMDEEKVTHIQMPKQFEKAEAFGWITAMTGLAGNNISTSAAGILSASRNTSTTVFKNVKTLIDNRKYNTIRLNQHFDYNQVYAENEDYDFVWSYISERCINAKIRK